jgi:ubiquinone/menaquinone biosynthesis C-methylase UbiE
MITGRLPFYQAWKSKGATYWKKRRFNKIMNRINLSSDKPIKILEVGCANGKDFIQFIDKNKFEIYGVDLNTDDKLSKEINFVQADASSMPFEDKSFDVVVSIGLLEHIEPIEKLCDVISEFDRIGKHQVHIIPSVSTFLEPHSCKFMFSRGIHKNMFSEQKNVPLHLNFFTEHTWTKFKGFWGCNVEKFYYLPPFIKNTIVYK